MQGKATFRGHPLHLMLVSFPIAFWSAVVVTDSIAAFAHDPFWSRMSVVLIAMGTLTALPAALFGYIDFRTAPMSRRAKRVGGRHLLWSLGAIVAFPLAYLLRVNDEAARLGIIVTVIGSLILLVAGYYGSELANRHRVGIAERPPGAIDE